MISVMLAGLGLAVTWTLHHAAHLDLIAAAHAAVVADLRDGLFILDADDRVIAVNRAAEHIAGRPAHELTGCLASTVFVGHLHPCLALTESGTISLEIGPEDGLAARVYEVTSRALEAVNGRIVVFRDVSADQHAQTLLHARFMAEASAALASSLDYEATLQRVANLAIPALGDWCTVYMLAEDQTIRRVAVAYTGRERTQLALALRRYPPSPVSDRSSVAQAMRTGQSILTPVIPAGYVGSIAQDAEHLEIMRRLAFRTSITVPLQARGDVLGALAFFSSDPERRYDAADLALAEDLARRAGLAVDNARLYREAQRAIRARDEFLSVAAHELKTPLTSMLGFAQMLLAHLTPERQADEQIVRRALRAIEQQSERLSRLVSKLLDVARVERGSLTIEPVLTDIVPLVEGVVETMQASTAQHHLTMHTSPSLQARVDPLRLEQVLTNLIDNAIKFSPPGAPVEIDVSQDSLGMVRVTVTDRGPGVPVDGREHIFDRFYQAHAGHQASGIGLGLYICRQIVEQHGGSIGAEFPTEGGSRFIVALPPAAPGGALAPAPADEPADA